MSRLEKFHSYRTHPWLKKIYLKLKQDDLKFCESFLTENEKLPKGDFEILLNRMYLGIEKPKNAGIIQELLCCANSS